MVDSSIKEVKYYRPDKEIQSGLGLVNKERVKQFLSFLVVFLFGFGSGSVYFSQTEYRKGVEHGQAKAVSYFETVGISEDLFRKKEVRYFSARILAFVRGGMTIESPSFRTIDNFNQGPVSKRVLLSDDTKIVLAYIDQERLTNFDPDDISSLLVEKEISLNDLKVGDWVVVYTDENARLSNDVEATRIVINKK